MTSLPDAGVLVALFDPAHLHHEGAHAWFASLGSDGWATSASTENGFIATLSNPDYPGARTTVDDVVERLRVLTDTPEHQFWPGFVSLRHDARVDTRRLDGHHQVLEAYLLLLAVENGGQLVTFSQDVPVVAVRNATEQHLLVLS